ncbi:MAG: GAF and ANTAR domain-containing protein [Actinomycetota bacterium]|nr:GAF and ANTAR domain-containing protein [Actinomycetota bacterium]
MPGDPDELSKSLSSLSSLLVSEESTETTLRRVADLAHATIGSCDGAGVTLAKEEKAVTAACSTDVVLEVDGAQYDSGEGPCLDAIRQLQVFRVDTLPDPAWPSFSAAALEKGFNSVFSIPLTVRDEALGALNLYSRQQHGFDACEEVGLMFAAQAAVALSNAQVHGATKALADHLSQAVASRDVIGQAKGILMAREGCTAEQAFDMLRRVSQRENRKLREVAEEMAARPGRD